MHALAEILLMLVEFVSNLADGTKETTDQHGDETSTRSADRPEWMDLN